VALPCSSVVGTTVGSSGADPSTDPPRLTVASPDVSPLLNSIDERLSVTASPCT
jgi:hypothetical protein